jgi:hypothetical protein
MPNTPPEPEVFYAWLENHFGITVGYARKEWRLSRKQVLYMFDKCDNAGLLIGTCEPDDKYIIRRGDVTGYFAFGRTSWRGGTTEE